MTDVTKSLYNFILKQYPTLKTCSRYKDGIGFITGMCRYDSEAMIKDIDSWVWDYFEGRIKECEYTIVDDAYVYEKYMTFRAIPETAKSV